jgi:hypothetical protein
MPQYRAFIIDSDGELHSSLSFDSADDDMAVKKAADLVGGHHIELWQFTRKVAAFDRKRQSLFQA